MQICRIQNIDDEMIRHYRRLHYTPKLHTDENLFIAEGSKTVNKLIRSKVDTISIFTVEKYLFDLQNELNIQNKIVETIYVADKEIMDEAAGFKLHEGLMAIGKVPSYSKIDEISENVVVLNGIVNSENVGSIVRNALAFGIGTVMFDTKTSSPYLRRAVRVSLGSCFFLDFYKSQDLITDLAYLKNIGYRIVSIELGDKSTSIYDVEVQSRKCFIFGAESQGIYKEILDISDEILFVPINACVDSLNVAATSAVVLSNFNKLG